MTYLPRNYSGPSEQTLRRRPTHCLTASQIELAKAMRDEDPPRDWSDLAAALGVPVEDAKIAIAPTRSRHGKRGHINTTLEDLERFRRHALPDEAAKHTFSRIMDTLERGMSPDADQHPGRQH